MDALSRWIAHLANVCAIFAAYYRKIFDIIYQKQFSSDHAKKHESLHQTRYKDIQQGYIFEESAKIMEVIIELITQVRKLKTEKQLSLKVPLTALTITATDEHLLHKVEAIPN